MAVFANRVINAWSIFLIIPMLKSSNTYHHQKMMLTFQTQTYSPWKVFGFRLNPFFNWQQKGPKKFYGFNFYNLNGKQIVAALREIKDDSTALYNFLMHL